MRLGVAEPMSYKVYLAWQIALKRIQSNLLKLDLD